jgi:hypothetical protein
MKFHFPAGMRNYDSLKVWYEMAEIEVPFEVGKITACQE